MEMRSITWIVSDFVLGLLAMKVKVISFTEPSCQMELNITAVPGILVGISESLMFGNIINTKKFTAAITYNYGSQYTVNALNCNILRCAVCKQFDRLVKQGHYSLQ